MKNKKTTKAIVLSVVLGVALLALIIISVSSNIEHSPSDGEKTRDMNQAEILEEEEGVIGFLAGGFGFVFWIVIVYFIWTKILGGKSFLRNLLD